jgi:hypothetical protein
MYDCASLVVVYLILLPHSLDVRSTLDGILWFQLIYFDIQNIGGSFGCDAITSSLVMKVVNIKMKSDNIS